MCRRKARAEKGCWLKRQRRRSKEGAGAQVKETDDSQSTSTSKSRRYTATAAIGVLTKPVVTTTVGEEWNKSSLRKYSATKAAGECPYRCGDDQEKQQQA